LNGKEVAQFCNSTRLTILLTFTQIANLLGCHRHTVENVLERTTIIEKQTRSKSSMVDPYNQQIEKWHKEGISRLRIYEKLQEEYGLHSSYINICKYMQKHFPKPVEAYGVQMHTPGETAEIDFGELGRFPGPDGKLVRTFGLAVVLPYSKLEFYAITYDQKLETLCTELENAFVYFGGVPFKIKVDNMKTAILKNQHYNLEFNQDFLEFAYHYHYRTVIVPCEPYSPEQKGTVEAGIKYLQNNFISGRTFADEGDLKKQLRNWMVITPTNGYTAQQEEFPLKCLKLRKKPNCNNCLILILLSLTEMLGK